MKYIWFMGGFGNVLFQILAFRVLKKNGCEAKINKILTERNFLTKTIGWSIHQPLYKDLIKETQYVKLNTFFALWIVLVANISKIFNIKLKYATFYSEKLKFEQPYANNIFGYFQDIYFLEQNKNELIKLGQDIQNLYGSAPTNIVVHYRKGDSGWAKKYLNYYAEIRELIKKESSEVIIVTDSLEDAKDFFSNISNVEIIQSKDALDDFKILLSSKKLYGAPSTFSWWAAHSLDKNSEVILPRLFKKTLGVYIDKKKLTFLD